MRPGKNYTLQIFECFKESKSDETFSPDWNPMLRVLHFSDQILQLRINEHQKEIYVIYTGVCKSSASYSGSPTHLNRLEV